MSAPTLPAVQTGGIIVQILEGLRSFLAQVIFAAGIDVSGTAIFRGPVRSTQGVLTSVSLGTPAAASASVIGAALAANSATLTFTVTPGPDVPRNATVTFPAAWDGGNVTLTGTDINGNAQTEVITASASSTVKGVKIFTTITAAAKAAQGASSNTATVGVGTKLGVIGGLAIGPANAFYTLGVAMDVGALDTTNQGIDTSAQPPNGTGAMAVQVCQ